MKNRIASLFVAVMVAACATPSAPIAIPDLDRSSQTQVIDMRPASEKKGETFSLLITSDAYGTSRLAEDEVKPSPVRLLQHRAFLKLAISSETSPITVHHLVIYRNIAGYGKRVAAGSVGGLVGAALAGSPAPLATTPTTALVGQTALLPSGSEEWKRALSAPNESSSTGLFFVVLVDTEANGRRVVTRTFYPAALDDINAAIPKAMDFAISNHVDRMMKE